MCLDGAVVCGFGGHGAHALYVTVPAHTLVLLPDDLSFGARVRYGNGLWCVEAPGDETRHLWPGLGRWHAAGGAMGVRVIGADNSGDRRQMALEKGADVAIDPSVDDAVQAI
tara:strand:- start:21 stop:356 length:336 start_codon:yes stop_codon:yes gene_type:complete